MANEVQHRVWRDDINTNASKALSAAEKRGRKSNKRFEVAIALMHATSNVILAERISDLANAILHDNELVSRLYTEKIEAQEILERLADLTLSHDEAAGELRRLQTEAISWVASRGEIDQQAAPLHDPDSEG